MEVDPSLLTPEVIWFCIGVGLLLLELVIPGLIIFFFGIGAWITAVSVLLFAPSLNGQLLIFILSSVGSLAALRQTIKKRYMDASPEGSAKLDHEFIGQKAISLSAISPEKDGKVEYKGSQWEASSASSIKANTAVRIIDMKSIRLVVEPY